MMNPSSVLAAIACTCALTGCAVFKKAQVAAAGAATAAAGAAAPAAPAAPTPAPEAGGNETGGGAS